MVVFLSVRVAFLQHLYDIVIEFNGK